MDPTEETAALAAFTGRRAGGELERRAALHLTERVHELGRGAELEPFRFHHRWALAQAVAAALAVVGGVLSVGAPEIGAALVAAALVSSTLEALGRPVLARLLGVRASQNVSAPPPSGSGRGLLVLAASYDAPRASAFARLADRVGDPWPWVAAIYVAALLCCLVRVGGVEGDWLTALQLLPTLALLALVPALVDAELAPVGDGLGEAAGTACALALTQQLDGELRHLDVWLVLAGAGAANRAGMRAWRRRHRRTLAARPAVTVEVGAPEPGAAAATVASFSELARGLDAAAAQRG